MSKKFPFKSLILYGLIFVMTAIFMQSCGSSGVQLSTPESPSSDGGGSEGESSSEEECTDTGDPVTTSSMTVTVSGTACNAPSASALESGDIILDCSEPDPGRNTSDSSVDFVTVLCESGTDSTTNTYYCSDGVVFKDDGGSGEELYGTTNLECVIDGDGDTSIVEEVLIVS